MNNLLYSSLHSVKENILSLFSINSILSFCCLSLASFFTLDAATSVQSFVRFFVDSDLIQTFSILIFFAFSSVFAISEFSSICLTQSTNFASINSSLLNQTFAIFIELKNILLSSYHKSLQKSKNEI